MNTRTFMKQQFFGDDYKATGLGAEITKFFFDLGITAGVTESIGISENQIKGF